MGSARLPLPPPGLVRATAVAAFVGRHPRTVRRWAATGRIPSVQVNSRLRLYDPDEVAAELVAAELQGKEVPECPMR